MYEAYVYGIHFCAETEKEVHEMVQDYVWDELSGAVETYEVKEF